MPLPVLLQPLIRRLAVVIKIDVRSFIPTKCAPHVPRSGERGQNGEQIETSLVLTM